jgi:hypothetical protein
MTDFSFRAVQIIEDTLNAVQQADEIEGLDLEEYVRVMHYLAKDLNERASCAIDNLLEMTA